MKDTLVKISGETRTLLNRAKAAYLQDNPQAPKSSFDIIIKEALRYYIATRKWLKKP